MADSEFPYEHKRYQRFNESLDEVGTVQIAGTEFLPSRILYEMEPIGYVEAYQEFQDTEFERLKDTVYNQYPSCIAYNFRLSEKGEGASDPVRKLLHLKDTWESIAFVLYAIVWGEIRHKGIDLKAAQVLVGTSPTGAVYRNFNTDRLISDALKIKIQNLFCPIHQLCPLGRLSHWTSGHGHPWHSRVYRPWHLSNLSGSRI